MKEYYRTESMNLMSKLKRQWLRRENNRSHGRKQGSTLQTLTTTMSKIMMSESMMRVIMMMLDSVVTILKFTNNTHKGMMIMETKTSSLRMKMTTCRVVCLAIRTTKQYNLISRYKQNRPYNNRIINRMLPNRQLKVRLAIEAKAR